MGYLQRDIVNIILQFLNRMKIESINREFNKRYEINYNNDGVLFRNTIVHAFNYRTLGRAIRLGRANTTIWHLNRLTNRKLPKKYLN